MLDAFETQWKRIADSVTAVFNRKNRREKLRKWINEFRNLSPIDEFKKLQEYCLNEVLDDASKELISEYEALSGGLKRVAKRIFADSCALKLNTVLEE